jgi:hypothetical protein
LSFANIDVIEITGFLSCCVVEIVPRDGLKDFNIKFSEVAAHFEHVVNS